MSDATVVGSAPANPIADMEMPDDNVAAIITDAVPGTHVDGKATDLGEHVYSAVKLALKRERNRVDAILKEFGTHLAKQNQTAIGAAQIAELKGDARAAAVAKATAAASHGTFNTIRRLAMLIGRGPGTCRRCIGEREVPSRLVVGQKMPCPACCPVTSEPAAPPAGTGGNVS